MLAVLLFEGLLFLWLVPSITFRAMFDWRLYEIMNASMVIDGLLFWFLVLDPRPCPIAPIGFFTRLCLAFLIIFPQIGLGTVIGLAQHDLYPSFSLCGRVFADIGPLLDQQIGALVLWVPAGMMSAFAAVLIMGRMFRDDDRIERTRFTSGRVRGNVVMSRMILPLFSLLLLVPLIAQAKIPDDKIKIGVLRVLPAPDAIDAGNGGIVAAQLAAGDFDVHALRDDAEIIPGTTRGTTDQVLNQVRDWLDKEHVAAVLSSAGPLVDAEIAKLVAQRHRTLLVAANDEAASGNFCSPNMIVWGAGATPRALAIGQAIAPHAGNRWFLLADQSPGGLAGQTALQSVVQAGGGKIVGEADNVVGGADLGTVMPQIVAANAQVVALVESDWDLVEILRSAMLMGLPHATTLVAPYARIADIDDAGPAAANGLIVVAPYYWDTDDRTRDFARRWSDRMPGQHVTEQRRGGLRGDAEFPACGPGG